LSLFIEDLMDDAGVTRLSGATNAETPSTRTA
jgi:hypothetical protein